MEETVEEGRSNMQSDNYFDSDFGVAEQNLKKRKYCRKRV